MGVPRLLGSRPPRGRPAFEEFIDWVIARWRAHPELHVYHYAHYEPTALKRLAGQHGTREEEVDDLLRHGVLVDLYAVVRQAVRISRPSYSIKELEALYRSERRQTAVGEGGESIEVFEEWLETGDQALLDAIEEYNADDCRSTRELRDWLLERRAESHDRYGVAYPYVELDPRVVSDEERDIDDETRELMEALLDRLPLEREVRGDDQQGLWLLAQLLDYHRRERRVVWWRFFRLCGMDHEQLLDELEAISGLEPIGEPEVVSSQGATAQWFSFPAQEFKVGTGDASDPATKDDAGEVLEIDAAARRLRLRRTKKLHDAPLPRAIFPFTLFRDDQHRRALRDLARADPPARPPRPGTPACGAAARPRRTGPRHGRGRRRAALHRRAHRRGDEGRRAPARRITARHPRAARVGEDLRWWPEIVDLLSRGQRVGITSNSHKAICKLLAEVDEASHDAGVEVRATQEVVGSRRAVPLHASARRVREHQRQRCRDEPAAQSHRRDVLAVRASGLAGATARLPLRRRGRPDRDSPMRPPWQERRATSSCSGTPSSSRRYRRPPIPTAPATACWSTCSGSAAPSGAKTACSSTTRIAWRPDVCEFISDLAYDGRLSPAPGTERRRVDSAGLSGTGLRFIAVEHEGNRQSSPEEARRIADEIDRLLHDGWVTDEKGARCRLTAKDVLVVAAYNHQVACLRENIPHADVAVGTVDKFQGQEAPVVFYSLATSTPAEAPRGIEFLFSRNRLNVAVSRAQCIAVLVGNPALLDAECRTVEQMRLVNGACRFVEQALSVTA